MTEKATRYALPTGWTLNTSGLLIVAKNGFVQEQIIKQMKAGIIEKRYLAVLDGIITADSGSVDAP